MFKTVEHWIITEIDFILGILKHLFDHSKMVRV